MLQKTALIIGALSLIAGVFSDDCPSFFTKDDNGTCTIRQCLNGGYLDVSKQICICPSGYLGIHCEAVKTSLPPDNHFKVGGTTFNIMNINLYTEYWGVSTYANIQKGLAAHFQSYPTGYDKYNLVETSGTPYLDNVDQPQYDISFDYGNINSNISFSLDNVTDTGIYWCYEVAIYENLIQMIQKGGLSNTVITIITQHPPLAEFYDEARQIAVAFGIRINVLWISDIVFNACSDEQISQFKTFVDITGGLFVQLQAEKDDLNNVNLISQVLLTHYKPQYVSIQSFPDCTSGQIIPVVADPVVSGPYNFVFLGASANPTNTSFTACLLRQPLRSYDNQLVIFQSPDPTNQDCANLEITTASGGCTGIVFTNAAPASGPGPLDLAISTTYVENPSIDASRYAIVEGVPFYPALHVESSPTAQITLNSISASFDSSWNPQLQKRSPAAFEWIPSTTINCNSTQTYSLFLNISVDSTIVQRAVRVACVPVPVITTTTAAATTTEPLASTTTGEASSSTSVAATTSTDSSTVLTSTEMPSSTSQVITTTTAAATTTEPLASTTTGEASSSTSVAATTSTDSSTVLTSTEMPSSTSQPVCTTQDNFATFLFAYAADFDPTTYGLVSRTIGSYVTANLPIGQILANVLTDLTTQMDINYTNVVNDFTTNCVTNQPNATLALSEVQASTALQTIRKFLNNSDDTMRLEGSTIILLVNRLPKNGDDLEPEEYDQLTNLNVRIFPIITIRNLVEHSTIASRSGAVFNRVAAQTNGHYIVANDTIGIDVNSDFNKIIANFMKTSYNQNLLFVRNIGSNRFLSLGSTIGTLRVPKSPTGHATIPVTITVSLSAVDTNVPQPPRRLLLAILGNSKFNQTQTVQIDFLNCENVTRFANSNYYTTTVNLDAGIEGNLILLYDAGQDQNDVLIRMWTPNAIYRSASYANAKSEPLEPVNQLKSITESTGAALNFTLENKCSLDKTATLLITDCNGEVSAKYDSDQIFNWKDASSTFYQFVPFFCDNQPSPTTCISGAESKYDVQFVSNDFSVTQSFQCRPGSGPTDNCKLKDSNGNYQCSGTSPFMRGPEGSLSDCSGHGHLEYTQNNNLFSCICDSGFSGPSCEIFTCTNQNTDPLAKDNAYHTYTIVVGLEKTNGFLVFDDAQVLFGLPGLNGSVNGTVDLPEVWKYQLLTVCADGVFDMIYSGSDLGEFQRLFTSYELLARTCNTPPSPGVNDLTTIYKEAVKGIGRNVKGIIVYFSEVSSMINVTLDEFIAASQPYQQQFFVYAVDEGNEIPTLNNGDVIAKAAMSTGGFLIQSYIVNTVTEHIDDKLIPTLLKSSTSIAWYSDNQIDDFSYYTQDDKFAYVVTWNAGDSFKNINGETFRNCKIADNKKVECLVKGKQNIKGNVDTGAFYVAVYLLDDLLIPKAQIISDLDRDSSNAVSSSSSDTRTMLTFNIPKEYDIIANSEDGGVTRNAKRNGCTFDWTAYSVFATQKYTPGLNIAKITLQDASSNNYTRFFPFGTSSAPVCQNGGTPIQSDGSCLCSSGFQGSDCSLVNCSESSTSNAWSDVCVCNEIDDATCARQFTSLF